MALIKPRDLTLPLAFAKVKQGSKLVIVGEAPGKEEIAYGVPFVGPSGQLLSALMEQSGLNMDDWTILNVFNEKAPKNDIKAWTVTKTDLKREGQLSEIRYPPLNRRYLLPAKQQHVDRLRTELDMLNPDFVLILGGTALWALTGDSRITNERGTIFDLSLTGVSCKALATFHPAMVLRQWKQRPIVWADLSKVQKHLAGTLPEGLQRTLWINPTFEEIEEVYLRFQSQPTETLGVDIETDPRQDQITMISFGTPTEVLCIPIFNKHGLWDRCHYWKTAAEEAKAWRWIMRFGALPNPKVGQNFLYDHQYLLQDLDIRVRHVQDDTAILQHAMQPELPKALGTLASLFLAEPSWKFMRESDKDQNKADD